MGLLEVKNLTFGYDNQIENVFDNISFKVILIGSRFNWQKW